MAAAELIFGNLPLFLLLAGTGLIVAEAFAPGAHFFVVGVSLFAAGLVGLVLPSALGALSLIVMAGVVLLAAAVTLYAYRRLDVYGESGEGRTSDSASLRGKTGRVTERVTPTEGEVKVEGGGFTPYYEARSVHGEIEEGETVMVVDPGGGNIITVESVAAGRDDIDRELARGRERDEADRETETETESSV